MRAILNIVVICLVALFQTGLLAAGLNDQIDDKLAAVAEAARAEHGFVGLSLVAVMPDGTGVAGLADAAHQLPLTADGRFRAGSTGKVLFSAVALQLVAEGRLDLDAPISTWFGARDWFARLPNARAK